MSDSFFFQLYTYIIDHPIGEESEEKVCFGAVIGLVVYGAQVEVCFELTVGTLYLSYKVVVVPDAFLI